MASSHCISNDHVHRSPVSGYVTIGNVRVRLSASGSTVSQPGGDSECCCGVPWPSRSRSRSRIPLPNSANNRRGPSPVYRTSLEWTQQKAPNNVVTSCFGKDKTESAGVLVRPSYFRLCNAGADTDTQCLLQDQGDSPQLDALDRLHKFRFGGSDRARGGKRSNPAHKKKPRSSDKTERLRELTEKLKAPPCSDKLKQSQPGPSGVSETPGTKQRLVPVIDYREKHKLVPLIDHKDKQRLVPLIDHKDKHKQVPFLDNKDKQKIVPLLDRNEKQKTVSSNEHRDKSKIVPLFDHKDRHKLVPFSELNDNPNIVPLIEHSDRQNNVVPFSESKDNQKLVPLLVNSDKQKLVSLSEHNNNKNLEPLLDKCDNKNLVPLSDNKHNEDTFESKEKPKSVPLVKQCCVGSVSEVNDIFECVNLRLPKPECRTIVGSYIQRSIPFRSASFSQVDFSPVDGKYIRSGRAATVDSGSLTFPRKKPSENSPYVSPSSSTTKDLDNDLSSNTWKETSVNHPSQDIPLEGVREESDTDSALAPSESDQCQTLVTPEGVEIDTPQNCNSSSTITDENISEITETISVSEGCVLNENNNEIKEENLLNEDAVNNNAETPQIVEETYVAKWPDESKPDDISEYSHLKEIELPNVINNNNATSTTDNKVQNESVSSEAYVEYKRWSDEGTSGDRTSNEWPSSAQEEPQSPEEVNVKLSWNVPKERKGKLWLERPRLVCQSSEEKEDDQVTRNSPKRYQLLTRADSLSEGESDPGDRRERDRTASPSLFAPSDQSDCESRFGGSGGNSKSPHPPRRYSKRPLRGPYGQMLEAEMKKPETRKFSKLQYNEDLKFLEDYVATPTRAVDDCHLKRSYTSPDPPQPRTSPKRKVSANIPYSAPNPPTSVCDTMPIVHHQRTTSSPSQLEGCSSNPKVQRPPQPSPQLLAQLLKGSSERVYMADIPSQHWKDTRTHVVVELYDTERSYVESLQILVMKYLQPLKSPENAGLVDVSLVDEIFYQVPTILTHHEEFLEELKKRLEHWDVKQRVGDIFLDTFTKQSVIETYTAFINNWKTAKEAIKTTCQAKPAFARFLEAMAREHKGKLALDSLLIMPVQRIPRYELLIQTLLKHTEPNHPDHQPLVEAQKQVHALAVRINCTERDSLELEQLEGLIEGLMHLVAPDRTFIRHDFVTMASGQGRKERAIFLFSDLLVITSIKRRSGTIRKSSTNCPGSVASALEANKYKLLMKISLEDLEIVKAKDENLRRMLREMDNLVEDVATLTQMSELVSTLHCPHSQLEDNIKEMLSALNKQLIERQNNEAQLSYLELMINTQSGIENISVIFSKPDKRSSWEEAFNEAKQRLALSADKRPSPEFMAPVPIRKTRAGLQFTCAAPTLNLNNGCRDVWVCNSDGYVGQVCVLSLNPEPTVTSCNGVCNARILCIAAIPAGLSEQSQRSSYIADSGISISVEDTDKSGTIHLESSSSSEEDESDDRHEVETGSTNKNMNSNLLNTSSTVQSGEVDDMDNLQPTMWLGTEDGCIHVYNCSDNIRIKKNKVKIQHGSAVHSIIYLENRVFVSLANGDISVYMREANGSWNTSDPYTVTVGTVSMPVTKMVPISGRLWCSCHSVIKVLNTATLLVEHSFNASGETQKSVSCIVVSGLGVWISLQNSAIVRLFHANSFECLGEVNIAPSVTKMLASCDDIIRQHKAACLRVTSLLACKDLLWVGTSAGVVLTMPLPHISASTCKVTSNLTVSGVPHGHTGHVRFLTVVETKPIQSGDHHRVSNHNQSNKVDTSTNFKLLVISGGDGYEDFRSASMSEVAGREDSTNHLLLWHV